MLWHVCRIYKKGADKPISKAGIDSDVENGHVDVRGKGRVGGRLGLMYIHFQA